MEGRAAAKDLFARLDPIRDFAGVADPDHYTPVPDDWLLLITDVEGSTQAIEQGRYKDVNTLGVASIVAVRNALEGFDLPFVFGGDGATMLVPGDAREVIEPALRGLQITSIGAFDLSMRAGLVPVAELRAAGHDVLLAKYQASEHINLAMLAGSGLSEGERWVKDPELGRKYALRPGPAAASYEGFECRWEPLQSRRGDMVCLLVQARSSDRTEAAKVYRRVVERIADIAGDQARPAHNDNLNLGQGRDIFDNEARLKSGSKGGLGFWFARAKTRFVTAVGRRLLASGREMSGFDGATYKAEVAANTDDRKFDDTLRMVLDLQPGERQAIADLLAQAHANGELVYGLHAAPAALMTCVISDYAGQHTHFVDGSDGGYALAAKQLKAQLKAGS